MGIDFFLCLACNNYHGLETKTKIWNGIIYGDLMEDAMVVAMELSMLYF
jgi:hypothetical protein